MIAQHGTRSAKNLKPIRYDALASCLAKARFIARVLDVPIVMPRIGCGLAGGEWSEVEPIIARELSEHGVEVFVFDLPGAEPK